MAKTKVETVGEAPVAQKNQIQKWRYALLIIISASFILFQLYIALVRP